jgi:5-methylthioadenosine/S-adenosylhomocysteine deaminase
MPPIARGAVVVEDDRIVAVGHQEEMARLGPFAATVGSEGHVVLPGLINGHHHAGRTLRAGLPDLPFERRNLALHRLVTAGTEESLYRSTLYSCVELLRAGVTSAAVIFYPNTALPHFGAEAALRAYLDSGMRVAFAVAQRDRALYVHEDDEVFLRMLPGPLAARVRQSALGRYSGRSLTNDEYFAHVRQLFGRWHGRENRIRIDVGPDWFPSATDALLLESRRVARELGTQIQIHLLETRYEMLMARRWLGQSAVEHLAGIEFLGPDVVCAHSVWLTERDMDLYASTGVVAVHNPASNLRLFSGIAPVREMLARKVTVAIGGDGLTFGDDNDLLSDLRLAGHLQRTRRGAL